MRNIRWISGLVVGTTGAVLIALAYYLGWKGIPPSGVGFAVGVFILALAALEWLTWWLAENDHNAFCPVPATIAGGGAVAFAAWLAPHIGWLAAGATVALVVVWVSSIIAALFIRR